MNLRVLKNPNFLLYLLGQATSAIGDSLFMTALSLYVLDLTSSVTNFAAVFSIGLIPKICIYPFAGVLIDRFDRRKLLIWLDLSRGVFLLGILFLAFKGSLTMPYIYLIAMFFGLCSTLFDPAVNTMIPFIFTKEEYSDAYAVDDMLMTIAALIAPMLGAAMYSGLGIKVIILIDAVTFLISAFAEVFLKLKPIERVQGQIHFAQEIWAGLQELCQNRNVLRLTLAFALLRLLVMPMYVVIVPYLFKVILRAPNMYVGTFQTVLLLGSITGPFLIGWFSRKFTEMGSLRGLLKARTLLYAFFLLVGVQSFMPFYLKNAFYVLIYLAAIAFIEVNFSTICGIFSTSYFQRQVQEEFLGRFATTRFTLYSIASLLGYQIFGMTLRVAPIFFSIALVVIGIGAVAFMVSSVHEIERV